ncbi:L-fuconolactonase [Leifsonia sp. EB41]|uniref:amidohydrolase family protein n=1 Tax=Leifsonia sp. EB41 TaxID=3156260 RepID=UPI003515A089
MNRRTVIDSHHHLWDSSEGDYPWMVGDFAALHGVHDMAELAPLLRSNEVEATVAVQARGDIEESLELLRAASAHPEIAGVVGWVDLTAPAVGEQLATLRSAPGGDHLVGVRHGAADETDPDWLRRDDVIRGLRIVSDAGLTFDLEVTRRELAAAITVADRIPELPMVVDHLAKPSLREGVKQGWADGMTAIADRPNVMAKVSGLVTEAHWDRWTVGDLQSAVDVALEAFGPTRLMFGSDWPVCELAAPYDVVLASTEATIAALSLTEQAKILSENARTFYGLSTNVTRN